MEISINKYMIDESKCLGCGATAKVYLGIDLENEQQYAFKCSRKMLEKEVSNMKTLDHKNVIKFYDSLIDFQGYKQVIVMEYCNKGSLYDFSESHCGLCDNMFLKVLECLYEGMSYLQKRKIIHRDIKPSNIMIHQDYMGYYHAKLGDLGTAKEVAKDESFASMVGTVEYLHPDMYIKYIEKLKGNFNFDVDLWSMGVTLYHAAVTTLPFLTFGPRNSKESKVTLKWMYQNKKPGIISGTQNSANNYDITWSDHLPENCRFSTILKDLASKLIGSLMDLTVSNSFERFFEEAKVILSKKRFLIFNSLNGELQMAYLDEFTYSNILEQTSKVVKLPKADIIILTKNRILQPLAEKNIQYFQSIPIKGHTRYVLTDDTALVICNSANNLALVSPELPNTTFDEPPQKFNFKEMPAYSKKLIKAIYQVSHAANTVDCQIDCYMAMVNYFNELVLKQNVLLINHSLPWQIKAIEDLCTITECMISISKVAADRETEYVSVNQDLIEYQKQICQLREEAKKGEKSAKDYYNTIIEKQEMLKYTEENFFKKAGVVSNDTIDLLVHLSEDLVNEINLIPEEKVKIIPSTYKLEIWHRQYRLLKYYKEAKEKFNEKRKCIENIHCLFKNWSVQAFIIKDNIKQLRDFLRCQDDKKCSIIKNSLEIKDFLIKLLGCVNVQPNIEFPSKLTLNEKDFIALKIKELSELTDKLMKKFRGQQL